MANTLKQLGQAAGTTSAVSIYNTGTTPAVTTIVTTILIVNTGSTDRVYSIYHDDDGTTYNTTTVIYQGTILGNETEEILTKVFMTEGGASANLAVKQDVGTDLNFTVYGVEQT